MNAPDPQTPEPNEPPAQGPPFPLGTPRTTAQLRASLHPAPLETTLAATLRATREASRARLEDLQQERSHARPGDVQSTFGMDDFQGPSTPHDQPEEPEVLPARERERQPVWTAPSLASFGAMRADEIPLEKPWHQALIDRLRSDRRIQLGVLCGLAVVLLVAAAAPRMGETSIAGIRKSPGEFDGRVVTLRGRVGEVFAVGTSHAYNLHQGRDTIVVFTRASAPIPKQNVRVQGTVSMGYLEGVPRAALFQTSD